MSVQSPEGITLLPEITCPNCWKKFPPEKILAIAGSPELTGDPKLSNPDERRRFPPTPAGVWENSRLTSPPYAASWNCRTAERR